MELYCILTSAQSLNGSQLKHSITSHAQCPRLVHTYLVPVYGLELHPPLLVVGPQVKGLAEGGQLEAVPRRWAEDVWREYKQA